MKAAQILFVLFACFALGRSVEAGDLDVVAKQLKDLGFDVTGPTDDAIQVAVAPFAIGKMSNAIEKKMVFKVSPEYRPAIADAFRNLGFEVLDSRSSVEVRPTERTFKLMTGPYYKQTKLKVDSKGEVTPKLADN